MNYLSVLDEIREIISVSQLCNLTDQMREEWENEKVLLSRLCDDNFNVTIIDLVAGKFVFTKSESPKWLEYPVINMEEPATLRYLDQLTYPEDRHYIYRKELTGYEILMSLPPDKRMNFRMNYHRRLRSRSGGYFYFLFKFKVYKSDAKGQPWLISVQISRLPAGFNPEQVHFCEFSHQLPDSERPNQPLKKLSKRERQILELAHDGYTSPLIAQKLGITHNSVKCVRKNILRKMNVSSMHAAYEVAHKLNMI